MKYFNTEQLKQNKYFIHIDKYIDRYLIGLAIFISIISFIYFYKNGQLNLAYGDAVSRLNISRKLTDNLTPGLGQLGSVWLPLPHIIMGIFVVNDFVWHTGLGGYLLSGVSFVVLVYFLFQLGILAFKSRFAGLVMSVAALINVNLIYMQTTAMTEVFFITCVVLSTYFLLKWSKTFKIPELIIAAVFVSACTLIRYEGYFVLAFSILIVGATVLVKFRDKKKIEGYSILFTTLAATGVILWCFYCWAIFKDPLYWKEVYTGEKAVVSTEQVNKPDPGTASKTVPQPKSITRALTTYSTSGLEMNGLIVTSIAFIGSGYYLTALFSSTKKWKRPQNYILFLPVAASLFVIYSIYNGFPLELPALNTSTLFDKATSIGHEYNIRYGLNLFPFVAIFLGYLAAKKNKAIKIFIVLILFLQLFTTFATSLFTIYSLPVKFAYVDPSIIVDPKLSADDWLKQNYDNGLIMISAYKHDPDMFKLGLQYKRYIHEGAGKYWDESIKEPQKYVTWVYMNRPGKDSDKSDEPVTKNLGNNSNLYNNFNLVYESGNIVIYKIKTHPEVEIKN